MTFRLFRGIAIATAAACQAAVAQTQERVVLRGPDTVQTRGTSAWSLSILLFSSKGFRFPLTTLPTPAPLETGRPILEIGGLAFFNSRVTVAPTVARF